MNISFQKINNKIESENSKLKLLEKVNKDNRKSLTARVKPEDLIVFNQRLKLFVLTA